VKNAPVESRPTVAADHEAVGVPSINSARKSVLPWLVITGLGSGVALGALFVLATYLFGSVPSALAFLRGNGIIPDAYVRDFGTVSQGQQVSVTFSLKTIRTAQSRWLEPNRAALVSSRAICRLWCHRVRKRMCSSPFGRSPVRGHTRNLCAF
jgi:hypothetical protein